MEMRQAKRMLELSDETFESITSFSTFLEPLRTAFLELNRALQLSMTLPVSTAGCERSFSKLKLIKNHLHRAMLNNRLKCLDIISFH